MALSCGFGEGFLLTLHMLLIGRSGSGKKIARDVLEFVSPVYEEAHPTRVTVAGLCGPTKVDKGKYTSTPGLLAKANGGSFVVQDFHSVEDMKKVCGTFSMVMEDGVVKNSTSAMTEYKTNVSILLDLNRKSQITSERNNAETDDLWGVPLNVLTRFDSIEDLPESVERRLNTSLNMLSNYRKKNKVQISIDSRKAKLLVAFVKEKFADIELSEEIRLYARSKMQSYLSQNTVLFEKYPSLVDFQLRMTNSLIKLITVISRSNFRYKATIEDVDVAATYLKSKMRYLKKYAPDLKNDKFSKKIDDRPSGRQRILKTHFSGKSIATEEVFSFYEVTFNMDKHHQRLIYRDLKAIARNSKKGFWDFT